MASEVYFSQVDIRIGDGKISIQGRTYNLAEVVPVRIYEVPATEPRERWQVTVGWFAIAIVLYLLLHDVNLPDWIALLVGLGVATLYKLSVDRFKDNHDFVLSLDTPTGLLDTPAVTKKGYLQVVVETIDKAKRQNHQLPELRTTHESPFFYR